jgi:transposase InsO family protein
MTGGKSCGLATAAEWIARQLIEAFGWEYAPKYFIRDRDRAYGEVFTRRVRSMGIRDRPTAPRSPWQNGHAERLIGSIRRECLDHVVVFGESHLRHRVAQIHNSSSTHPLNRSVPPTIKTGCTCQFPQTSHLDETGRGLRPL